MWRAFIHGAEAHVCRNVRNSSELLCFALETKLGEQSPFQLGSAQQAFVRLRGCGEVGMEWGSGSTVGRSGSA